MARTRRTPPSSDWPAWRYAPDGTGQIFQCAADVPPGWMATLEERYDPGVCKTLDSAALTKQLQDRGVVVLPTWSAAYMKELLEQ